MSNGSRRGYNCFDVIRRSANHGGGGGGGGPPLSPFKGRVDKLGFAGALAEARPPSTREAEKFFQKCPYL